jgi:hypothetical protein
MASYQLVLFNASGMVDRVNVGTFADDDAAKSAALELGHEQIVEVTRAGVRIARIPPRTPMMAARAATSTYAASMSLSR